MYQRKLFLSYLLPPSSSWSLIRYNVLPSPKNNRIEVRFSSQISEKKDAWHPKFGSSLFGHRTTTSSIHYDSKKSYFIIVMYYMFFVFWFPDLYIDFNRFFVHSTFELWQESVYCTLSSPPTTRDRMSQQSHPILFRE